MFNEYGYGSTSEKESNAKIPPHLKRDIASFLKIGVDAVDSKKGIVGELRIRLTEILDNEGNQQNIRKGVLNVDTAMAIYLFSQLNQEDSIKNSLSDLSTQLDQNDINLVINRVASILETNTTQSKDITGVATNMMAGVDTSQTASSSIDKKKFAELNKAFLRKTLTEAISVGDKNTDSIIEDIMKEIDFESLTILEIYNESNEFISQIKQIVSDEINSKLTEDSESESDTNSNQIDTQVITRRINEILHSVEKID